MLKESFVNEGYNIILLEKNKEIFNILVEIIFIIYIDFLVSKS